MRLVLLVCLLAGCQQLFGLDDPRPLASDDASTAADGTSIVDAGQFATCSMDATLVACFDFNGIPIDSVGNSLFAANVSFATGQEGQAGLFSSASKLTVNDSARLDVAAVTTQAWLYPDALPATGTRAGIWDTDGQYGMFILAGGVLNCTGGGSASSLMTNAAISAGTWSHVACTNDGMTIRAYINGVLAGSLSTLPLMTSGTTGAEVGGNAPDMLDRFIGRIDLLRVYSVARSAAQVCADARCL